MLDSLFRLATKFFSTAPPKRVRLDIPPEQVTVLVVDDDTNLREQIAMIITQEKVRVKVAASTQEALAEMVEADILILDWKLGDDRDRGGQLVFQQWKQLNPTSPVAVVSAYMTPELQHELLRSGAYNAVGKPAFDVIVKVVSRYIDLVRNGSKLATLEANIYSLKAHVDALNDKAAKQQTRLWIAITATLILISLSDLSRLEPIIKMIEAMAK